MTEDRLKVMHIMDGNIENRGWMTLSEDGNHMVNVSLTLNGICSVEGFNALARCISSGLIMFTDEQKRIQNEIDKMNEEEEE